VFFETQNRNRGPNCFFIDYETETPFNFDSADLHEYRDRFKNDNTNLTVNKIIIEMIAFFNREEWNSEENEGSLCMHHVHHREK
jgi:hypothetical protein